jgi:hypothetical protein
MMSLTNKDVTPDSKPIVSKEGKYPFDECFHEICVLISKFSIETTRRKQKSYLVQSFKRGNKLFFQISETPFV